MGSYHDFKIWLVMYVVDMLMSQHQLNWNEIREGIEKLEFLRQRHPLAPINFPDFNPKDIKGHTHVCKKEETE
jgi:hypothetical protein